MANTRRRRKMKTKVNTKKSRHEENQPIEEENQPIEEENQPVEEENLPIEEENLPIEEENLPVEEENLPVEEVKPIQRRPNRVQRLQLIDEPEFTPVSLVTMQLPVDIYKKINIATDDVPHKLSSSNKNDWYVNLNSKLDLVPSMVYLELHGIGKHTLKKQVVDHILDTLPHEDRLLIAKYVKQPGFNIDTATPLEKHIAQYFDFLTINDSCLVLAKSKGVNRFYNIHDWSEKKVDADDEMYRERFFVDIDDLSDIIGYVEDEEFKIRENRRVFSMKSSKTELISEMNEILKLSGSNFWYDIATSKDKKKRNSDNLSHIAFYAIMEMLIRKLNSFDKIWFLKPEQMAFMKS
jgi:hypothetical protein